MGFCDSIAGRYDDIVGGVARSEAARQVAAWLIEPRAWGGSWTWPAVRASTRVRWLNAGRSYGTAPAHNQAHRRA